jgi:transcriptional regulator with XRE-family HTH domain
VNNDTTTNESEVRTMNTDTKNTVIALWDEAYAKWERGEGTSPSANDLARIANEVDPTLPDTAADAIYAAECEGKDLAEVYDAVYG